MDNTVSFRVPNFVDPETGIFYSDIEIIVEMEGDLHGAVQIVEALQRPLGGPVE